MPSPDNPRILIVRIGAMGDILHALPAIAQLRAHFPGAFLGWAIEPRWATLLRSNPEAIPSTPAMPLVDHLHEVPTRAWSKHPLSKATASSILALRRDLRTARYDLAIDLQGSIRSATIARLSGAPRILGPADPREAPARWLYRTRIPTPARHVIDQAHQIVEAAVATLDPQAQHPIDTPSQLPLDPTAEAWANETLATPQSTTHAAGQEPTRTILLAPTAGWGAKQWPTANFAELAAALATRGHRILLNANPPLPDPTAQSVHDEARNLLPPNLHGNLQTIAATLPQLIALLRRVDLVIAGDTGPLHLAAALGIPVVALFGPTDPARTGPHSAGGTNTANAITLRDPASRTDHRRHPTPEAGLTRIRVDTVLHAATTLLAASQ